MNFWGRTSYGLLLLLLSGIVAWLGIVALKFIPLPGIFGALVLAVIIGVILYFVGRKNVGPYFSKKYGADFNKKNSMMSGAFPLVITVFFFIQSVLGFGSAMNAGGAALVSGTISLIMYVFWVVGVIALFIGSRKNIQ